MGEDSKQALDILFDLRMTADICLFLRAKVNIMLAAITMMDMDQYDVEKFADEGQRLCEEIRLRHPDMSSGDSRNITHMEIQVQRILGSVKAMKIDLRNEGRRVFPKFVPKYHANGKAMQVEGMFSSSPGHLTAEDSARRGKADNTEEDSLKPLPLHILAAMDRGLLSPPRTSSPTLEQSVSQDGKDTDDCED